MKRFICLFIVCLLFVSLLPTVAFATKDVAAYYLTCTGLPEGAKYVDLLIKLPATDACYTPLVSENLPNGFSEDAQIITYCTDDYRSYTFHYKDALSQIAVDAPNGIWFFADGKTHVPHLDDVTARGEIKLAMLDANGNILKVSGPQSLKPKGIFVRITPELHYDAQSDTLDVGKESFDVVVVLFILAILVVHCLTKMAMALLCNVWFENQKLILLTSAFTTLFQIAVCFVWVLLMTNALSDVVAGVVLLMPVVEFALYRWKMFGVSWKRSLLYTLVSTVCCWIAEVLVFLGVLIIGL